MKGHRGEAAKYSASVVRRWLERPAYTLRPRRATADPMRSATRTVWRALLVRPLLQLGRNHQMAVVTGGVTSRVGDVLGGSGTTWPRSQQRRGAQEGLPVAATKQQQTARQRRKV